MRKLNAPGDSVQDVFSTCIESYRDAALKKPAQIDSSCSL